MSIGDGYRSVAERIKDNSVPGTAMLPRPALRVAASNRCQVMATPAAGPSP